MKRWLEEHKEKHKDETSPPPFPICFLDEKWFYMLSGCHKRKVLPLGPMKRLEMTMHHKLNKEAGDLQPK